MIMPSSHPGSRWQVRYPPRTPNLKVCKTQKSSFNMTDYISSEYKILLMSPWNNRASNYTRSVG